MTRRFGYRALALGAAALIVWGAAQATAGLIEHPVGGRSLVIKDPGAGFPGTESKRSATSLLQTGPGGPAIVGNPINAGATLSIVTDGGAQCFDLPRRGWTLTSKGFRYEGAREPGNPAVSAQVTRSPSGQLQIRTVLKARFGTMAEMLTAVQGDVEFRILDGDAYCGHFAGAAENTTKLFKAVNAPAPGFCGPSACAVCGDSVVQIGEGCDSGGVDSATCNGVSCTTAVCGDKYVNAAAGEQCDSGGVDTPTCVGGTCKTSTCGDGYVNAAAHEVCDPPGSPYGLGVPFDDGICDACQSPSGAFIDGTTF